MREVQHRIKNNLQGIIGLLKEHFGDYPQLNEVLKLAIGKIRSIALIHGMQSNKFP